MSGRFQAWLDNTGFHHRWMANGPLWWACASCRGMRDGESEGQWTLLRAALRPTGVRLWKVEAPVTVFVYARTRNEAMGRATRVVFGRYWFARFLNRHRKTAVAAMGGYQVEPASEKAR